MIARLAGETDEAFVLRVEGAARRSGESDKDYAQRLSGSGPPLDPFRLIIAGAERPVKGEPGTADAKLLSERFVDALRAAGFEVASATFYAGHTGENPPVDITDGDPAKRKGETVAPAKAKSAKKATKKAAKRKR